MIWSRSDTSDLLPCLSDYNFLQAVCLHTKTHSASVYLHGRVHDATYALYVHGQGYGNGILLALGLVYAHMQFAGVQRSVRSA